MVHVDYEVVKVPRTGVRANELAPRAALTPSRSGAPEKMSAERKGARGMAMGKCKAMGVLALQSHESARRVGTNGASSGKEAGKSPAPSPIDSGPKGGPELQPESDPGGVPAAADNGLRGARAARRHWGRRRGRSGLIRTTGWVSEHLST